MRRCQLILVTLLLGSSSCRSLEPFANVNGHVTLREYNADQFGNVTDSTDWSRLSGVEVRLISQSGQVLDQTLTRNGRFAFAATPGRLRVEVGPATGSCDTADAGRTHGRVDFVGPGLFLANSGRLVIGNNPAGLGGVTRLFFGIPRAETLDVRVERLDGTRVRQLALRAFPGGQFILAWDHTDDRGSTVPTGRYWAVIEALHSSAPATPPFDIVPAPAPGPYYESSCALLTLR